MDYLLVSCQKLKKKKRFIGSCKSFICVDISVTIANKYLFPVIRHRAIKLLIQVSFSFSDRQYNSCSDSRFGSIFRQHNV